MKNIAFFYTSIFILIIIFIYFRFIQFLNDIYKPNKSYIDIKKLRNSFISIVPDFNDFNQHDTCEFMDYILNTLDDALKKYKLFLNQTTNVFFVI